jgi:hypothetical protein
VVLLARVLRVERREPAGRWPLRLVDALLAACGAVIVGIGVTGGGRLDVGGASIGLSTLYTPVLVASLLALVRAYLMFRPRVRLAIEIPFGPVASGLSAAGAACIVPLTPMLYTLAHRLRDGGVLQREVFWRSSPPGVDFLAFLAPNPNHPILDASARHVFDERHDAIEDVASLTFVALAVVILGVWKSGWRLSRLWLVVTLFFGALALGPFLHVGGVDTYVPGPWALLRYVPLVGAARTPARFAIVAVLGFAVLFAQALVVLRARSSRPRLLLAGVAAALAFELSPAPRLLYAAEVPEVYRTIAADPRDITVMQLPFGIRDGTSAIGNFNTAYQFYQTFHEKRLIGGYLSRISRRQMARQRQFPLVEAFAALSEGKTLPPERLAALRSRGPGFVRRAGIGYIVIDRSRASSDLIQFAITTLNLEKIQDGSPFELYRPR